ncbi:MAG: BMC domain-containing protein [Gammaproteobacteria bacterium]|nr:BMC domain-containing protein [Gammaproteobacteria bacterium]
MRPALALLEFDSVARGIEAGDQMVKRAPVEVIRTGTVHPGKYLVLVAGEVADVEEAVDAGRAVTTLVDVVLLPDVHPDVAAAVKGARRTGGGEALGIIETRTVAAVIQAADAGVKGANVTLLELRMADGLGGKGYLLFQGPVSEVEAAVEIGSESVPERVVSVVIPQLHREMGDNLVAGALFTDRVGEE